MAADSTIRSAVRRAHALGLTFSPFVFVAYLRLRGPKIEREETFRYPRRARCLYPQVSLLSQAAGLLVTVKTHQFKREIAAKKEGGKSKPKRGVKDKKGSKQE